MGAITQGPTTNQTTRNYMAGESSIWYSSWWTEKISKYQLRFDYLGILPYPTERYAKRQASTLSSVMLVFGSWWMGDV